MQNAVTALGAVVVYQVAEAGISNILALKSYECATNPFSNILLRRYGGEGGAVNKDRNKYQWYEPSKFPTFYVSTLSYDSTAMKPEIEEGSLFLRIVFPLAKRVFVRIYAVMSTHKLISFANQSTIQKRFNLIASIFFYLQPPLRIKFTAKVLESSPSSPTLWLNKVEANQIGLRGLVTIGITKETPKRMINNPKQVMVGIIQMGCALFLIRCLFERFKNSPCFTATAMMLA